MRVRKHQLLAIGAAGLCAWVPTAKAQDVDAEHFLPPWAFDEVCHGPQARIGETLSHYARRARRIDFDCLAKAVPDATLRENANAEEQLAQFYLKTNGASLATIKADPNRFIALLSHRKGDALTSTQYVAAAFLFYVSQLREDGAAHAACAILLARRAYDGGALYAAILLDRRESVIAKYPSPDRCDLSPYAALLAP